MYLKGIYDEEEIWVPILRRNVKDYYRVSNFGRVKNTETGIILKTAIDKYGYEVLSLQTIYGKRKMFKVHRLVLLSFSIMTDDRKFTVNHIDGNKLNNNLSNLEWSDLYEQQQHSIRIGLKKVGKGENAPNNVYSEVFIHKLCKLIAEGRKPSDISKILNIPNNRKLHSLLYRIRSGRHWYEIYSKYK